MVRYYTCKYVFMYVCMSVHVIDRDRYIDRQTDCQACRQTDRQTASQPASEPARQRQTDRQTETYRHMLGSLPIHVYTLANRG